MEPNNFHNPSVIQSRKFNFLNSLKSKFNISRNKSILENNNTIINKFYHSSNASNNKNSHTNYNESQKINNISDDDVLKPKKSTKDINESENVSESYNNLIEGVNNTEKVAEQTKNNHPIIDLKNSSIIVNDLQKDLSVKEIIEVFNNKLKINNQQTDENQITANKNKLLSLFEPSLKTNYLYLQINKTFKCTTLQEFKLHQATNYTNTRYLPRYNSVKLALTMQNSFHQFALVIQGILAGTALAHALFSFSFNDVTVLIQNYQWLAIWIQMIFYVCFVISTVDALDRYTFNISMCKSIQACIKLQNGGFGIFIYFCGCIASILMTRVDELLAIGNPKVLQIIEYKNITQIISQFNIFVVWQWLSIVRAVFAILGWFIFALQPTSNYTFNYIKKFMEK